jgi:hypothetical protein
MKRGQKRFYRIMKERAENEMMKCNQDFGRYIGSKEGKYFKWFLLSVQYANKEFFIKPWGWDTPPKEEK